MEITVTGSRDEPAYQIPSEWLVAAGMQNYMPSRPSYRCDKPNTLIPLADIEMPKRNAGIRSDTNGFRRDDMLKLLTKIRNGDNIWPVKLVPGGLPYVLYHGFRRFYAFIAVGFSHIPAVFVGHND